jgi:hypothetical protein
MPEEMSDEKTRNVTPTPGAPAGEKPAIPVAPTIPVAIVAGGIFLALALGAILWIVRRPPPPPPPRPTEDARAYLSKLIITDFHLSAADNMIGSVIVYLDGKVTNSGERKVRRLRVQLSFTDTLGQVILLEEREIVSPDAKPLYAGETRDFQLRFNRPPSAWNVQPPEFRLISLELE